MFRKRHQGVICKIAAGHYYILTPKGDFESIRGKPPHGLTVGENIAVNVASPPARMLAVAVALMLFIGAGALLMPGSAQVYSLTVDFNPSLVFRYDQSFAVVEAQAFNGAGLLLLNQLKLESGENLYTVINRLAAISLESGLLAQDGDIFFSSNLDSPLDQDLLLGAFEGRGISLNLVQVALDGKTKIKTISPLRGWLETLAADAGADNPPGEAIKVLADKYLPPSSFTRTQVTGWFEEPLVQYLVGEYRVSGGFVNSLLARGFSGEDIALILALAKEQKLAPGNLIKDISDPNQIRGNLENKTGYGDAQEKAKKAGELEYERQSLEYLAAEFGYPVGRLTAFLKQAGDVDTLTALLILERQGAGNLSQLLQALKRAGGNLEKMVEAQNDSQTDQDIKGEMNRVKEKTERARGQQSAEVDEIAVESGTSRSNIVWLLSRGYSRPQCQEIQRVAHFSNKTVTEVTRILEGALDWQDFQVKLGLADIQLPHLQSLFRPQGHKDKPGGSRGINP